MSSASESNSSHEIGSVQNNWLPRMNMMTLKILILELTANLNMTNGNCMQIQLASIRTLVHNAILHVGLRGYLIMAGHQDETCQAKQVAQHVHDLLLLY